MARYDYYDESVEVKIPRRLAIKLQYILSKNPKADIEEVKHGEWKQGVPYVCSICGKSAPEEKNTDERYSCWTSPFCPHCGAKMDGGNAE